MFICMSGLYVSYSQFYAFLPAVHVLILLGFFASLIKAPCDVFLARQPNGKAYVKCPPYWLAD